LTILAIRLLSASNIAISSMQPKRAATPRYPPVLLWFSVGPAS